MKEINYISEIFLPSKSAYSINVMKMCDAFSKLGFNTNLYVFRREKNINLFKIYNCKKKFKIIETKIYQNNFIGRIKHALILLRLIKKKKSKSIIYSRSIISSLILSIFHENVLLEIHHELKGFTKVFFNLSKKMKYFKRITFVYISKNLKNHYMINNRSIILDDGVDLSDFKNLNSRKRIHNTCVYTGSFTKGKGIELILKIAKITNKINFHLYGDISNSKFTKLYFKKFKNVYYKGFAEYKNIPKILNKYYLYLMPYSKKVFVRSNNLEVGNYMSPLKLFEYMASKGVVMATEMNVYKHVLNKKNSILINKNSSKKWKNKIERFFANKSNYNYLSKNSNLEVKNYSWELRVKKILSFINV